MVDVESRPNRGRVIERTALSSAVPSANTHNSSPAHVLVRMVCQEREHIPLAQTRRHARTWNDLSHDDTAHLTLYHQRLKRPHLRNIQR